MTSRPPRWQPGEVLHTASEGVRAERVALDGGTPGTYQNADVIYRVGAGGEVDWVYPRRCDHAGGQLCLSPDHTRATCPLHGWDLDLATGRYRNVDATKTPLPFEVKDGELRYERSDEILALPAGYAAGKRGGGEPGGTVGGGSEAPLELRFLAHAGFEIRMADYSLVIDPWLLGPCFLGGWWLDPVPKADAIERLEQSDAVFLSHNHPDHMHPETLACLPRSHAVLVPRFSSGSAERSARRLGFLGVETLGFNTLYRCDDAPFALAVLRSSGFRDDSGLLVAADGRSVLFTVDSSALNGYVLPRPVDLLLTSFAGGASGYPLCFEQYPAEERVRISKRHAAGLQHEVATLIAATTPRGVIPYAGYFTEAGSGDGWIRENNVHNSVDDIRALTARLVPDGLLIDPRATDTIALEADGALSCGRAEAPPAYSLDDAYVRGYEARVARDHASFELEAAVRYFGEAAFSDDLVVSVLPCDRDFAPAGPGLVVDFRATRPRVSVDDPTAIQKQFDEANGSPRRLEIRARREALAEAVCTPRPLEELSIGFQCRFRRNPDHYNSAFWNYFTNLYPA